jgi:hypothetical protein
MKYIGTETIQAKVQNKERVMDTHNFLFCNTKLRVNDMMAPVDGRYKLIIEVDMKEGEKFSNMLWDSAQVERIGE